jgi:cytoskeletal protein RodZ
LLLVVGVAALSAVVVVGIGLPLLPRFEPTRTQPSAVPTVRPFTAPLPSVEPVNSAKEQSIAEPQPSTVSPTKSLRPSPTRASSKLRPKSSVTTSADEAPSTTPATQPTARKKNPLLVRPR